MKRLLWHEPHSRMARAPLVFCRLFIYSTSDTPEWLTYIRSPRLPSRWMLFMSFFSPLRWLSAGWRRRQKRGTGATLLFIVSPWMPFLVWMPAPYTHTHHWLRRQRCDCDVKSRAVTNLASRLCSRNFLIHRSTFLISFTMKSWAVSEASGRKKMHESSFRVIEASSARWVRE